MAVIAIEPTRIVSNSSLPGRTVSRRAKVANATPPMATSTTR